MSSIRHKWERDKIESQKVSYDELEKLIQKDIAGGPAKAMSKLPAPEGWDQTDSILIECEGWWWLHSNSDKRWRANGKAIVGGRQMCKEARAMFFEMKKAFGNPPFDFIYRFEPLNLKKFRLAGDDKKQL
jgi:hypothetical protein